MRIRFYLQEKRRVEIYFVVFEGLTISQPNNLFMWWVIRQEKPVSTAQIEIASEKLSSHSS